MLAYIDFIALLVAFGRGALPRFYDARDVILHAAPRKPSRRRWLAARHRDGVVFARSGRDGFTDKHTL